MQLGMTQRIYEWMMRRIIMGELAQGQVVTELALAKQFKSSRTRFERPAFAFTTQGF